MSLTAEAACLCPAKIPGDQHAEPEMIAPAGMIPMQLVASALAWENLWLFMPKDPGSDPVLQVCTRCQHEL